ncbi:hypothetical protein GJ496_008886 [Pomphorhynchus laevis]|nr:hypothetical protein GJ496_008886 [Pomphorhynchus laevis]
MVHNCIVTGCRYRKRKNIVKGIVFHSFPVDQTRLAKWQAAIAAHCPKPINITRHSKICQFHFLESDYVQTNHCSNGNLLNASSDLNSSTNSHNGCSYRRNTRHLKTTAVPSVFKVWLENGVIESSPPSASVTVSHTRGDNCTVGGNGNNTGNSTLAMINTNIKSEPNRTPVMANSGNYANSANNTAGGEFTASTNGVNPNLYVGVKANCSFTQVDNRCDPLGLIVQQDQHNCGHHHHQQYAHNGASYLMNEILSSNNCNLANASNSATWKQQPDPTTIMRNHPSNNNAPISMFHQQSHQHGYVGQAEHQLVHQSPFFNQSMSTDHPILRHNNDLFNKQLNSSSLPVCNSYGNRIITHFNQSNPLDNRGEYVATNDAIMDDEDCDHQEDIRDSNDESGQSGADLSNQSAPILMRSRKRKNLLDTIDSLYRKNRCFPDSKDGVRRSICQPNLDFNNSASRNVVSYAHPIVGVQSFRRNGYRMSNVFKPVSFKEIATRIERHDAESAALTEAIVNLDNGDMVQSEMKTQHEFQLYYLLSKSNLIHYYSSFIAAGGDDIVQLCQLSKKDFSELVQIVGMTSKPFHVKRLKKVLYRLRLKLRLTRYSDRSDDDTQEQNVLSAGNKISNNDNTQLSSSASTPAVVYRITGNDVLPDQDYQMDYDDVHSTSPIQNENFLNSKTLEHSIEEILRSDNDEVNRDDRFYSSEYENIVNQLKNDDQCDKITGLLQSKINFMFSLNNNQDFYPYSLECIVDAATHLCRKRTSLLTRKDKLIKLSKELSFQMSYLLNNIKQQRKSAVDKSDHVSDETMFRKHKSANDISHVNVNITDITAADEVVLSDQQQQSPIELPRVDVDITGRDAEDLTPVETVAKFPVLDEDRSSDDSSTTTDSSRASHSPQSPLSVDASKSERHLSESR